MTYNYKVDELCCKQKKNQMYNILKKTIPPFQTDEVLKEPLRLLNTKGTNK